MGEGFGDKRLESVEDEISWRGGRCKNGWTKLPLKFWNEEIAGLTEKFCDLESLADVKQVENFIDSMQTYRDRPRIYTKVSA